VEGLVISTNPVTTVHGDARDVLSTVAANSVDAIITDPPYPKEYLDLYSTLAYEARRILKDGGILAAMCGQTYLPQVYEMLTEHLEYRWTIAYLTPGAQAAQIWPRRVLSFWKPVIVCSKNGHSYKWFADVSKSATNDNDKRYHEWGQSVSGMVDLVGRLTDEGQMILDPFMGAGTTGVASVRLGRLFFGIERDAKDYQTAARRIDRARSEPMQFGMFEE
jgi:DNA modification methylase